MNSNLEDKPELVNEDPYVEGWIIKIDITDLSEINSLLSAKDYKNLIAS
jgi:glycine cleavage system H protein